MRFAVDPFLLQVRRGAVPSEWGARAIFSEPSACTAWLRHIERADAAESANPVLASYWSAIEGRVFDTFVSLGSGDGRTDMSLLRAGRSCGYIPVDIAPIFAFESARTGAQRFHTPIAIVGDFEQRSDFVREHLHPHLGERVLFAVLGNTLGNADGGEAAMLDSIVSLARPQDYLLISVATGKFSMEVDARDQISGWNSLCEFLAGAHSMHTGLTYEASLSGLEGDLVCKNAAGEVPGGTAIVFRSKSSDRLLLSTRRYDLHEFARWIVLNYSLELEFIGDTGLLQNNPIGIGVVLFRKK